MLEIRVVSVVGLQFTRRSLSQTVLKIAENLLNDPDNPKYQQFKPTNSVIQRELVKRKGVLEYVIEVCYNAVLFLILGVEWHHLSHSSGSVQRYGYRPLVTTANRQHV